MIRLNVNIDHIATLRQARRTYEPSVVAAAVLADLAGASGITIHLRGDRRHIQDDDARTLRAVVKTHLNIEMAATDEMVQIAGDVKPNAATLVPERAEEVTTEGGLDVVSREEELRRVVAEIAQAGVLVSLFVDPDTAPHAIAFAAIRRVRQQTQVVSGIAVSRYPLVYNVRRLIP